MISCSPTGPAAMAHEADAYASSNEGSKYSESNFTLDSTQDDPRFVRDRHFRVGCELLRACGTNDAGKVARILEAEPRMSTFKDYDGRTALHVAASEGRLELVRFGFGFGLVGPSA